MGSKPDNMENAILDHLVNNIQHTTPGTVYSALFTVIPSDSTGGTEVTNSSSGYTRVATTFVSAGVTTAGRVQNSATVSFVAVAGGATITVVGWGLMSDQSTGTIIYWATVTSTALGVGDQATFPIGNIVITED